MLPLIKLNCSGVCLRVVWVVRVSVSECECDICKGANKVSKESNLISCIYDVSCALIDA